MTSAARFARSRPTFLVALASVAAWTVGGLLGCDSTATPPKPPKSHPTTPTDPPPGPPPDPIASRLARAGWDAAAAAAVARLDADFLAALGGDDPAALEKVLLALDRLGACPTAMTLLRTRPELAGLLAADPDPAAAARVIDSLGDEAWVVGDILLAAPGSDGRAALLEALRRHGRLVARLRRAGVLGAEALFLAPGRDSGRVAYEDWLATALDGALRADNDDGLSAVVDVAESHGEALRGKLRDDAEFRRRFAGELWPALVRLAAAGPAESRVPLEAYLGAPGVWDVLAMPGGEGLLSRRGLAAVAALAGPAGFPPELRGRVARLLLSGDAKVAEGLADARFRSAPLFRQLLASPAGDATVAAAVAKLVDAGSGYRETLGKFAAASADAARLEVAVGPVVSSPLEYLPFYIQVKVAGKVLTGERVAEDEWADVAIDAVGTALALLPGGGPAAKGASLVVKQSLKHAARESGKAALRERVAELAGRSLVRVAGAQAGRVATHLAADQVRRLAWSELKREVRVEVRRLVKRADKALSLDITDLVQLSYERSGVGRSWFRKATELEARVLMRRDARVTVHYGRLALGRTSAFLKTKAEEAAGSAIEEATGVDLPASANRKNNAAAFLLDAGELLRSPPAEGRP